MDNFLINIDGLTSENLTSAILCYILNNDSYSIYQRIFYNYLFDSNENKTTKDYNFNVTVQDYYSGFGVPDILIKNDSEVSIIENKFYAPYSQGNQISRYWKLLNTYFPDGTTKKIFLLTIKNRESFYKEEIQKDINSMNLQIDVKFKFWEDILKLFSSNDFIIKNLTNYITTYYLRNIEFNAMQMEIIKNSETPKAIQKIIYLISLVRNRLNTLEDYKTGRMDQSTDFYGFEIKTKEIKVWFGYYFKAWLKYADYPDNSPVYMQIGREWSNISFNDKTEKQLSELNFKFSEEFEWIKPYNFNLLSDIDKLVNEIKNDLELITKILLSPDNKSFNKLHKGS